MTFSSELAWCEAMAGAAAAAPDRVRDDAKVIQEFLRSGDDELFGVLVQRYKDLVFRLVASIIGPVAETEAEDLVLRQVDALGEPRRTVVFLFYWMGCDVDEISGLTEIPVGTVKSHLFRARRELAKRLSREAIDG